MVSTCSSTKDTCCLIFYFEIICATIYAAIMSALYFLSLLLTDSDISRFLSLFMVNIADACVAVTTASSTRHLWKLSMTACTTTFLLWLLKSSLVSSSSVHYLSPGVSPENHIVTFEAFRPSTSSCTEYSVCGNSILCGFQCCQDVNSMCGYDSR